MIISPPKRRAIFPSIIKNENSDDDGLGPLVRRHRRHASSSIAVSVPRNNIASHAHYSISDVARPRGNHNRSRSMGASDNRHLSFGAHGDNFLSRSRSYVSDGRENDVTSKWSATVEIEAFEIDVLLHASVNARDDDPGVVDSKPKVAILPNYLDESKMCDDNGKEVASTFRQYFGSSFSKYRRWNVLFSLEGPCTYLLNPLPTRKGNYFSVGKSYSIVIIKSDTLFAQNVYIQENTSRKGALLRWLWNFQFFIMFCNRWSQDIMLDIFVRLRFKRLRSFEIQG